MSDFLDVPAIFVDQPFSCFYITAIPVNKLIEICYSFPAVYGNKMLNGVQRGLNAKRIKNISEYSQTESALFPNSIILSANILKDGTIPEEDNWHIENNRLLIPTNKKYGSIVDGQHRVEGLKKAVEEGTLDPDFSVVCAVYFELTAPQQAEVFATINFNQQKVDKSLAYQLFGYDLDSTESEYWSPDTLAIYFSRLLDSEEDSPFFNRVKFGMKKEDVEDKDWKISTSTLVEGIARLISTNPTADRYLIHKKKIFKNTRSVLSSEGSSAPLRQDYIDNRDSQLYDLVFNYFSRWKVIAWHNDSTSFMYKTIGIQALFDILRMLAIKYGLNNNKIIEKLSEIDVDKLGLLSVNFSGIGRGQIRNEIKTQLKLE